MKIKLHNPLPALPAILVLASGLAMAQGEATPPPPADEPAGRPRLERHGERGGEMMIERLRERLEKENPQLWKELMELRAKDPQAFRERVRALVHARIAEGPAGAMIAEIRLVHELARKVAAAPEGEAKEALKAELRAAVEKAHDKQLGIRAERLKDLEERLAKAKAELAKAKAGRAERIQKSYEELLANPPPEPPRRRMGPLRREGGDRPREGRRPEAPQWP